MDERITRDEERHHLVVLGIKGGLRPLCGAEWTPSIGWTTVASAASCSDCLAQLAKRDLGRGRHPSCGLEYGEAQST